MARERIFQRHRHPIKTFSLGLQHVLAMYAGAVVVPIIVSKALGFTTEQLTYLIAIDLLACGVATLLQVWGNRFFGVGLPVMLGCAFQAVSPMILIGMKSGVSAIYGAIIASGIFVVLFSGIFGKLIRLFPPVVTGSVVTIIGLTLIPVAFNDLGGGQGAEDFGSGVHLLLGFGVLVFIILMTRFTTGFVRSISVLIGLLVGTVAAGLMGEVNFAPIREASWFHVVQPFYFGTPTFEIVPILTMILVAIVSVAESTGVFMALGKILDKDLSSKDLARGYRAEGLAIVLGGIFNSFPYTTYSQNVGLVQMTRVKTRDVIVVAGGLLVVIGFVPKIAALAQLVPGSVLGGAMVALFGMVVSSGIRILGSQVDLNRHENLFIIACSVGMGLGVTVVPQLFAGAPDWAQIMLGNGIIAGSFTAIFMNLLFNGLGTQATAAKMAERQADVILGDNGKSA
ncbi:nucleobase:cation symporter-2 family protein [Paenibacillus taichungensis]|jgi:xanthine permease|uniref:Xanthine permease n=1 Tax=Paenibacillus pabuli TaxID=1472 RepID=A0ABX9BJL3_9BACL|nr:MULTISPECIES: nucleobase:cation symporter-2 family protein [Paenibacillus]MCZ1263905.1 purine permease [Paenibacillus tundrae]MEC0105624.1 nucleobase:cation symporter-2 family protein [Paenibacillus taichungensis]MEC0198116.1 nucleobase:cation symporter-2 family protein [Paenibacillus taichungensis]NEU63035.1 purine permease [Paenibacillus sp. ALJ109b]QLG37120.1 purine permease [Paenibacillus sp. E222]